MDLLSQLDRVLMRAEVQNEGLRSSIEYLFEGTEREQISKIVQWIGSTNDEISRLLSARHKFTLIAEGLGDNPRVEKLAIKDYQAEKKVEQKRYLLEIVENHLRFIRPTIREVSIPRRHRAAAVQDPIDWRLANPDDLGETLTSRLRSI